MGRHPIAPRGPRVCRKSTQSRCRVPETVAAAEIRNPKHEHETKNVQVQTRGIAIAAPWALASLEAPNPTAVMLFGHYGHEFFGDGFDLFATDRGSFFGEADQQRQVTQAVNAAWHTQASDGAPLPTPWRQRSLAVRRPLAADGGYS